MRAVTSSPRTSAAPDCPQRPLRSSFRTAAWGEDDANRLAPSSFLVPGTPKGLQGFALRRRRR